MVDTPRNLTENCPRCQTQAQIIWVHGHGQCAHCGQNVEPCCQGSYDELQEDSAK